MRQSSPTHTPTAATTIGHHTITTIRTIDGGYTINVIRADGSRVPGLGGTTSSLEECNLVIATIREGLAGGVSVEGIRQAVQAARASRYGIKPTTATPAPTPVRPPMRRTDTVPTIPRPRLPLPGPNLADTVPAGEYQQVPPTMAGAHLAPMTPAGQRAIDSHINGIVYPGDGISRSTLRSLDRKGYGNITRNGANHRITSLVLNGRGLRAVGQKAAAR